MKNLYYALAALAGIMLCACSGGSAAPAEEEAFSGGTQLVVANWNLQTFFDGKKDGCEYKEYQKAADWNTETYKVRLERLCEFITSTDADIYVFEEIENEEIIYDISNELSASGKNWKQKDFWNYSVFAKEAGTAIGIGILSRYPLSNIRTHTMDIRIHSTEQPTTRYILESEVSVHKKRLVILANHWKSKSGGEQETEIWRDWQESLLGKRVAELLKEDDTAILICGDFNRDAADFVYLENIVLRFADFGYTDYVDVNSLWFTASGDYASDKGSYFYDDRWERIDNIMLTGTAHKVTFSPLAISPWATVQGYPIPYKIYSGQGWSDHLPLCAQIAIGE